MDPPRERWTSGPRAHVLATAVGVGLALGVIAAAHPDLRFVDFLSFANRARRLREGQELVSGLYPVGYPAVLLGFRLVLGDVLVAGKVLAVLAAVGAALAGLRLVGPGPTLAMVALPGFLAWGSTEGTDLPAYALGLGALALARERPALAGALAGAACLTRYTGVAVLPAVLLLSPRRGRVLLAFGLATAPHWAVALWLGLPVMPDQSQNMVIGGGGPKLGLLPTLQRLPANAWRAAGEAWGSPWGALGVLGLLVGVVRKERAAWGLALWSALHLVGVGLAFSNPRLVLPATLAAGLGLGWLLPTRWRPWLALPAALLALAQIPGARVQDEQEQALAVVARVQVPPPTLASSPLAHQRRDGWLLSAANLRSLGGDPRALTPTRLLEAARARGFRSLVLDADRVHISFPGLSPLMSSPPPAGLELVEKHGDWRVFEIRSGH